MIYLTTKTALDKAIRYLIINYKRIRMMFINTYCSDPLKRVYFRRVRDPSNVPFISRPMSFPNYSFLICTIETHFLLNVS